MISPTFWSHTIWYILLGIATIIELTFIFRKVEHRKPVLALYFTISGMTFCFEMIVLSYFKAYEYYPKLIPYSPPDDSIAGNLFSQFSVSATALLIAVYHLRYFWFPIIAAAYGLIEEAFIALCIFKHHWYRTWMTVVALQLLFWIGKKVYRACRDRMSPALRYLFIFFGLVTLHQHLIVWALRLTGVRQYSETLLPDKEHSFVVLAASQLLILGVVIMVLYFSSLRWIWKLAAIGLLYVGHWIAGEYRIITYKEGWFFIASSVSIWGMYLFTFIMDKLYDRGSLGSGVIRAFRIPTISGNEAHDGRRQPED